MLYETTYTWQTIMRWKHLKNKHQNLGFLWTKKESSGLICKNSLLNLCLWTLIADNNRIVYSSETFIVISSRALRDTGASTAIAAVHNNSNIASQVVKALNQPAWLSFFLLFRSHLIFSLTIVEYVTNNNLFWTIFVLTWKQHVLPRKSI